LIPSADIVHVSPPSVLLWTPPAYPKPAGNTVVASAGSKAMLKVTSGSVLSHDAPRSRLLKNPSVVLA